MNQRSKQTGRISKKIPKPEGKIVPVTDGAGAFVELLNDIGVEYVFLNPGTDTFPIQKAISQLKVAGKQAPEIVLCLHESTALDAAHGYFMVSGKPQVVLVHADVGLQQMGGALHSAQRGRIPVVICSGVTATSFGEKRGGRGHRIHWLQDQFDQAGIVRNYVKWHYDLQSSKNIHDVVQRAFQVASTEPYGPVYISLSPEVLWEKMESVKIPPISRHGPMSVAEADEKVLEEAADILLEAERPLILTGYSGRHPESVESLVKLAEMTGARVLTGQTRLNFPSSHPLCAGIDPTAGQAGIAPFLADADVVFIIDHDVPYVPVRERPHNDAKIIHFDIDPEKTTIPLWVFPADISVKCDTSRTIPLLNRVLSKKMTPERRISIQRRYERIAGEHQELRREWVSRAEDRSEKRPIDAEWLCRCISEVIDDDMLLLTEVVSNSVSIARQIPRNRPGTLFMHGGSSLGWGLGAAVGAKLAAPDKTVVTLIGDGGFGFASPVAALWASSVYKSPFLTVIFNNESYKTVKGMFKSVHYDGAISEEMVMNVGADIVPSPDYALIAKALNAYGKKVEDPAGLLPALKSAVSRVKRGKSAVIDVRIG
jgi:acetolactate synthase-1/2/3 large subunit